MTDLAVRPLRAFVAVAELGSFTRAAERLHLTQPSLSYQITELERYLGFRLFDRTTRRVTLTAAGEALLSSASALVVQSDILLNHAATLRGDLMRKVRFGAAIYTSEIPERRAVLDRFGEAHRDIDVVIEGDLQQAIFAETIAHRIDLALVIGMPISRVDYDAGLRGEVLFPEDLCRLVLRRERVGLMVPAGDELVSAGDIMPDRLRGRRVVVPALSHGASLIEPILALLNAAGADPVIPPDGSGTGVEYYGRRYGLPAITFGWFAQPANADQESVRRNVVGLNAETWLALLAAPGPLQPAAGKMLAFAERLAKMDAILPNS